MKEILVRTPLFGYFSFVIAGEEVCLDRERGVT